MLGRAGLGTEQLSTWGRHPQPEKTLPALLQKSPVYFLLVGGWSFSLYLLQLIFKNLREICTSYWQYLLGG